MKFYLEVTGFFVFMIYTGCGLDPDTTPTFISYDSRETGGCLREIPYDQITNEALLTWRYEDNNLELYINIDTHCAASLKDSVRISNNNITIFLQDTVSQTSPCGCIYRETFYLAVSGYEEADLLCFFKPYKASDYKRVIDKRLALTPLP